MLKVYYYSAVKKNLNLGVIRDCQFFKSISHIKGWLKQLEDDDLVSITVYKIVDENGKLLDPKEVLA